MKNKQFTVSQMGKNKPIICQYMNKKNKELDMLIDNTIDEWVDQGRDVEHVYGVRNFMSGLGKKLIYYVYEKGRSDAVKEICEEVKKLKVKIGKDDEMIYHQYCEKTGYNDAIGDVLAKIKKS